MSDTIVDETVSSRGGQQSAGSHLAATLSVNTVTVEDVKHLAEHIHDSKKLMWQPILNDSSLHEVGELMLVPHVEKDWPLLA
jgi:hypothetical protein